MPVFGVSYTCFSDNASNITSKIACEMVNFSRLGAAMLTSRDHMTLTGFSDVNGIGPAPTYADMSVLKLEYV